MSDIVAVFSSPRQNGNSCTLGKAVIDGTMGLSTNMIHVHRLNSKLSVHGCQNCAKCEDTPKCYIEDDLSQVLDDIEKCDSLIIALPIFFNGPCAQFKMLLDRLYSHMGEGLKPRFPGKKLVMIITHDGPDDMAKMVENQLRDVFTNNLGYEVVGIINYRCDRDMKKASKDLEILDFARSLGKKL